jgi:hypothetical protein
LLRSFNRMNAVDLGFRAEHATTAGYGLPQKQYATQAQVDAFNNEMLLRLRHLPGVEAVGVTSTLPASGADSIETFIAGWL